MVAQSVPRNIEQIRKIVKIVGTRGQNLRQNAPHSISEGEGGVEEGKGGEGGVLLLRKGWEREGGRGGREGRRKGWEREGGRGGREGRTPPRVG